MGLPQSMWLAPAHVDKIGIPSVDNLSAVVDKKKDFKSWTAVLVTFAGSDESWGKEAVVCRLRHKDPATTSPLLWAGSSCEPLVPFMAPPQCCTGSVKYS